MKTIISLFFIVALLPICAPSSAGACPEGEYSSTYNSMCLTDSDFTDKGTMSEADIEKFLKKHGSFLRDESLTDTDGTTIDPAEIIYETAKANEINPQVLLAMLQKESSACTTPTRLKTSVLNFILGCLTPSTN